MTVRIGGRGAPREPWLGGFGTLRAPVHDARRAPPAEPAPNFAPPPVDAAETLMPSVEGMPEGVLPIRPSAGPPPAPVEPTPAGETMGGFGSLDSGVAATAPGSGGFASADAAWGGEGPRPGDPSIPVDGIEAPHPSPAPPASIEPMGAAPAAGSGRDASAGFEAVRGADRPSAAGMADAGVVPLRATPPAAAGDGILRRAADEAPSAPAAPPVMGNGPDEGLPRAASTALETSDGPAADAARSIRGPGEPRSLEKPRVRVEQMGVVAPDSLAAAERAGTAVRPLDAGPGAPRVPWPAGADDDEDDDPVLRFFRARERAHEAPPSAGPAQGRHVHIGSVHVTVAAPAAPPAPPPAAPAPAPYADPWAGYPRIFD